MRNTGVKSTLFFSDEDYQKQRQKYPNYKDFNEFEKSICPKTTQLFYDYYYQQKRQRQDRITPDFMRYKGSTFCRNLIHLDSQAKLIMKYVTENNSLRFDRVEVYPRPIQITAPILTLSFTNGEDLQRFDQFIELIQKIGIELTQQLGIALIQKLGVENIQKLGMEGVQKLATARHVLLTFGYIRNYEKTCANDSKIPIDVQEMLINISYSLSHGELNKLVGFYYNTLADLSNSQASVNANETIDSIEYRIGS